MGLPSRIGRKIPPRFKQIAGSGARIFSREPHTKRANIVEPAGRLLPDKGPLTFVVAVGPSFDQNIPTAHVCIRMGYCKAFEQLGIPYLIVDVSDLETVLPSMINPFCYIVGNDYTAMRPRTIEMLKKYPHFVWVDRWFRGSDGFFASHGLDASTFTFSHSLRGKILESEPSFVFTATVQQGLHFFEGWERHGCRVISVPFACDTTLYRPSPPYRPEFEGIRMAFVGGYWNSKGQQIDRYLRPFEDELIIYGYDEWPYRGYRGVLSREAEPSLYRQALVCPTINEPTVRLLHGNLNERVFKVLGSGGVTVVDAIPAYRELFGEDELIVPEDEHEFHEAVRELLDNDALRSEFGRRGREAVVSRHTYVHRARVILRELGLDSDAVRPADRAER